MKTYMASKLYALKRTLQQILPEKQLKCIGTVVIMMYLC